MATKEGIFEGETREDFLLVSIDLPKCYCGAIIEWQFIKKETNA